MIEKKTCVEFEFRKTIKTGALTIPLVFLDGKVLKPSRECYSRTGAHGNIIFCLSEEEWNRAWIIKLYQSNSGKRSVIVKNVPQEIGELIEQAWVYENADVHEIVKNVEKLFKIMIKAKKEKLFDFNFSSISLFLFSASSSSFSLTYLLKRV
jgi:hypothetical protein